jgi:hypothetical protein
MKIIDLAKLWADTTIFVSFEVAVDIGLAIGDLTDLFNSPANSSPWRPHDRARAARIKIVGAGFGAETNGTSL